MSRIKTFNLPDLGEGLTEGEILAWLVKVGDTIELNQPIVEVETAKAAVEIPAKWAGQVQAIHHPEGTTVEVGTPIIAIDTDPGAGPLETPSTTATPSGDLPTPSAASLAAVEVAPAEGMIEPGLIGGVAPGGRTAVLVGYGPRTTAAKRRPRKGAVPAQAVAAPAAPAGVDHGVVVGDKPAATSTIPAPQVHDR
ncbi:biotin/lipoyl-containing protein, partial [Micromonospora foliorum]